MVEWGQQSALYWGNERSPFLYTQVMLILILINVQLLQNVVFNFEKDLSGQNHSFSDSHHPIEEYPPGKFPIPPYPLTLFENPWTKDQV